MADEGHQDEYSQESLQNVIGYTFANLNFLKGALTRFKYLDDLHLPTDNNMDPIATVGDAVLDLVALEREYRNGCRDIGGLTVKKKNVIDPAKTRELAKRHRYHNYVQWDSSEKNDKIWETGDKTYDTCIEALIGAVYLDAQQSGINGIAAVNRMLVRMGFSLQ
jgi:ribonuclease III